MNIDYNVLNPWAEVDQIRLKGILPRVTDLKDKTIGLFCHAYKPAGLPLLTIVEKKLKERFPDAKITWYVDTKNNVHTLFDTEDRVKFKEWINANKVDTVIVARGDCGLCTAHVVRDTICVEEFTNTPAVALINKGFRIDAKQAASGKGMPGIRMVVENGPCETAIPELLEPAVNDIMDDIVVALTKPPTEEEQSPTRKTETLSRIAFKGNLEEVNRFFYKRGWTDGLPIIPPTEEAVKEMLTGTDFPADHLVAKIVPRFGKATVEKIAINAVMAGALATSMPLLIAGVQALVDPRCMFEHWEVSTASLCPLWIINGPVRSDLGVNSNIGAFSPGNIANAAIGRAMALIIQNIGGARIGVENMGVLGDPGKYTGAVAAEDEENNPWNPLHVEQGLEKGDSAISVMPYGCFIKLWPYATNVKGILDAIIYNIPPASAGILCIVLNPIHAKWFVDKGWTKEDIKNYVREYTSCPNYRCPTGWYKWWRGNAATPLNPMDSVAYMAEYDEIKVIVGGGPGNFIGLFLGPMVYRNNKHPMTKKVELPANWDKLVEKYKHLVPSYIVY